MSLAFLDTNVILYADDAARPAKRRVAVELFADLAKRRAVVVSTQVLQEYFAAATRKLGVDAATARRRIELLARMQVVLPDVPDILAAIDLHRLHRIAFWDALIIRAAQAAGCDTLYSEDMQDGRSFDGVRIRNPFA